MSSARETGVLYPTRGVTVSTFCPSLAPAPKASDNLLDSEPFGDPIMPWALTASPSSRLRPPASTARRRLLAPPSSASNSACLTGTRSPLKKGNLTRPIRRVKSRCQRAPSLYSRRAAAASISISD